MKIIKRYTTYKKGLLDHQEYCMAKDVYELENEMETLEEEARTYAEKVDELNDKVFKNSFTIVGLDEQIESLKCCGNCKEGKFYKMGLICINSEICIRHCKLGCEDNWSPKS